ncbi:MAG: tRNA pseudouridine(13) synthase TruD [Promethearchaeota archaeon]
MAGVDVGGSNELIEKRYERLVGIEFYSTKSAGMGGKLKVKTRDFIVREITPEKQVVDTRYRDGDGRARSLSEPYRKRTHKYTLFDLVKFNTDTILAVRTIAKELGIPQNHFSFAGIKDNRAITSQRVSVKGVDAKRLAALDLPGVKVFPVKYSRRPVRVGDLWGNQFEVTLRHLEVSGDELASRAGETRKEVIGVGFPNYFGLQRFGTHRPNSHEIGRAILLRDYEGAVKHFLSDVYEAEMPASRTAREAVAESWDFRGALDAFPHGLSYERMMLKHLVEHPADYLGAFKALPLSLQNLIVSSYQSYVFNAVLSARLRELPLTEIGEGELVTILDEPDGLPTRVRYPYVGHWREKIDRAVEVHRATPSIPIVGHKTKLGDSLVAELCWKQLDKDGITQEDFELPDFQYLKPFRGSYRVISVRPAWLDASVKRGRNEDTVTLKFSLPKGTYATMLLREFQK